MSILYVIIVYVVTLVQKPVEVVLCLLVCVGWENFHVCALCKSELSRTIKERSLRFRNSSRAVTFVQSSLYF